MSAIDADDTLFDLEPPSSRLAARSAMVVSFAGYVVYIAYRIFFTFNVDAPIFSALVLAAEIHGGFLLFFFYHSVWRLAGRVPPDPAPDLTVDVFVTTYNEDVEMVRQTVRAAIAMRHPHNTYVLDDGRRPEMAAMAAEVGAIYVTRPDNRHAKAGNVNHAFHQTHGDVIVTFDADHRPRPEFLERTLGYFRDPLVALVQVPLRYHNLDSVQHLAYWDRRRVHDDQDAFFNLVMVGKQHWNAAFFCGTGAVLRRSALEPLGGLMTDTITEDLHTSIELHSRGWKSVYVNETLVTGLAPMDLKAYEVQRLRWAEGNLSIMRFANPLVKRGLNWHQRVEYASSLFHWTVGVPKLVFYLAPPWMMLTHDYPIANFDGTFLAIYWGMLLLLALGYRMASRFEGLLLLPELFNMMSFFIFVRAVKRVIFGRGKPYVFQVTDKKGSSVVSLKPVLPHLSLLSLSSIAMLWSALELGFGTRDDLLSALTAMFWCGYNMVLMGLVVRIGMRPVEKRASNRFRAQMAVEILEGVGARSVLGMTADLSDQGCSLLWPTPLPVGQRLSLRLHADLSPIDVESEVKTAAAVPDANGWYVHGMQFPGLTREDVDRINDSVFGVVLPDLFVCLQGNGFMCFQQRLLRQFLVIRNAWTRERREEIRVPIRITAFAGEVTTVTDDISEQGVRFQSRVDLSPNQPVDLTLFDPAGLQARRTRIVRRYRRSPQNAWDYGAAFEGGQATSLERMAA